MGIIRSWFVDQIDPGQKWKRLSRDLAETERSGGAPRLPAGQGMDKAVQGELEREIKKYSAAELLPQSMNKRPIWKKWNEEKAIAEGYKASSWVYACVSRLMRSVGSVHWEAYKRVGDTWEPAPGHPMEQLINKPNEYQTRQTFFEILTAHVHLAGNALSTKVRVKGVPVELWPHHPGYIDVIPSRTNFIDHYRYKRGAVDKSISPADSIHWLFTDPETPYWGMAPLQAAARQVDTDSEAVNWNKVALQNRAVTDGVFSVEQTLSDKNYRILKDQVAEQHQGTANARAPWVLGAGAKWNQMSLSPAEMDFIESRKLGRVEICSIFQVPPPLVAIYDDATLANIETARLIYWEDTIIPFLDDLQSTLNMSLQPDFGDDVEIRWNASHISVFVKLLIQKLEAAEALFKKGVPMKVINELLDVGLPDYPGNNMGFLEAGLVPTSMMMVDPMAGDADPMAGFDDSTTEPVDEPESDDV